MIHGQVLMVLSAFCILFSLTGMLFHLGTVQIHLFGLFIGVALFIIGGSIEMYEGLKYNLKVREENDKE